MSDAWMPNTAMWIAPKVEQEFSSDMGTFKEGYVDYDRYSDECISRLRRFNRLLEVGGFKEETRIPSKAHLKIRDLIKGGNGKLVQLMFGACPMLLVAPPCRTVITHPKICSLIIPDVFSHFAGRNFCKPFDNTLGAEVPLRSVIYASNTNEPRLAMIEELLQAAKEDEQRWNLVTDSERAAAYFLGKAKGT